MNETCQHFAPPPTCNGAETGFSYAVVMLGDLNAAIATQKAIGEGK